MADRITQYFGDVVSFYCSQFDFLTPSVTKFEKEFYDDFVASFDKDQRYEFDELIRSTLDKDKLIEAYVSRLHLEYDFSEMDCHLKGYLNRFDQLKKKLSKTSGLFDYVFVWSLSGDDDFCNVLNSPLLAELSNATKKVNEEPSLENLCEMSKICIQQHAMDNILATHYANIFRRFYDYVGASTN